jgi:hypothetical protein
MMLRCIKFIIDVIRDKLKAELEREKKQNEADKNAAAEEETVKYQEAVDESKDSLVTERQARYANCILLHITIVLLLLILVSS